MTRLSTMFTLAMISLAFTLLCGSPAQAQRDAQGNRSLPDTGTVDDEQVAQALEQYEFEAPYLVGKGALSFEELVKGGTPFVLFWWLADCPVCHLQMPYIQQLQNYVERDQLNLRVVGINVDVSAEECSAYLKDKDLTFEMLIDRRARATNEGFEVEELGCPLLYVFAEGGQLVEVYTGFRAGIVRAVLEGLDLPVPQDLDD